MINRSDLRKKIPYGYCKIIAERAGVNSTQVSNYFSGKGNSERVENATLEVLAELSEKKQKLLDNISI